jgi:hypothetical protein
MLSFVSFRSHGIADGLTGFGFGDQATLVRYVCGFAFQGRA